MLAYIIRPFPHRLTVVCNVLVCVFEEGESEVGDVEQPRARAVRHQLRTGQASLNRGSEYAAEGRKKVNQTLRHLPPSARQHQGAGPREGIRRCYRSRIVVLRGREPV